MARDTGERSVVRLLIPKFPAAFVGTGDLFTALCTAWLHNTGGSLQLTLERTIGTMQVNHASTRLLCDLCTTSVCQAVLTRTLAHAKTAASSSGLASPSPAMMELKLIQSKSDIETPPGSVSAEVLKTK